MTPDGKIALNCNYRHATRSWELELPKGARLHNETIKDAAKREVLEETGIIVKDLIFLGNINPDSGTLNSSGPVFLAELESISRADAEESEAIISVPLFSVSEIEKGFCQGYLDINMNGKIRSVNVRDSFLAFALLQARLWNLLP